MDYLTTKEISELWGISKRRITLLLSEGRIKGAKKINGSWFIPHNATKPLDPRKEIKLESDDKYIFPYVIATVNSKDTVDNMSKEEKELYQLSLIYESGDFLKARELGEKLLDSNNLYIKLGALYHLAMATMYLSDYKAQDRYATYLYMLLKGVKEHRDELNVLQYAYDCEMKGFSNFVKAVDIYKIEEFPDNLIPYITVHKIASDMGKIATKDEKINFDSYELLCRMIESQGYFYPSMVLHLYLSLYYSLVRNKRLELYHMEEAAEIGISHNIYFTLAFFMSSNPEVSVEVLSKYPPYISKRIIDLARTVINSRNAYAIYQGRTTILPKLTGDDYRIIYLFLRGYSVKDMASDFYLSESGMKKRLAILYEKLGVKSKNELLKAYLYSSIDFGTK